MWTEKQLKAKQKEGKIRGYKIIRTSCKKHTAKTGSKKGDIPAPLSKEKQWILNQLCWFALFNRPEVGNLISEFRFHEKRKWQFDWAFPDLKIAIEYEGLMSNKSRHTTVTGYTGDANKYNQAQQLGWIVLRFTALNYKELLTALKEAYESRK